MRYPSTQVRRMQLRFSRQHLNAAPVFVSAYLLRLQCQSAGSLKTQECIISGGYISCGPRGFNSFTIMSSHLLFCTFFPVQKSLPTTTHEEIVALNLTCFFFLDVFSWNRCQIFCQSTTGLNGRSMTASSKQTRTITSSIFKFLTWVPQTPTCTAFLIVFEYIIFSTCRLTIS